MQVVVRLDSGEEVTGDVLIGADGIWSRVRKQLIGETKANYSGYTCYTGRSGCADCAWAQPNRPRAVLRSCMQRAVRYALTSSPPALGTGMRESEIAAQAPTILHPQVPNLGLRSLLPGISDFTPADIDIVGYRVFLGNGQYFVSSDVGNGKMQW